MIKFTIGTASSTLEFQETMRLIKSSLLYADEIELIGMVEYAVFCYLPRTIGEATEIEQLLNCITPFLKSVETPGGNEVLEQIDSVSKQIESIDPILKKKKKRSKQEILAQMEMKKAFSQTQDMLSESISSLLDNEGSQKIRALVEKKIVNVYDYQYKDFELDELVGGYFGNLLKAMRSNTAFPLFDNASENVIKSVVDTGILDIGRINHEVLRHAGVASNILMTLPTFENATIDEILDFKRENKIPLTNFRKAMFGFSEKIKSLPWDEDFQYECLKLYNTEVQPQVQELNELSSQASVIRNFGARVVADAEIRRKAGYLIGGIVATVLRSRGLLDAFDVLRDILLGTSLIVISPQIASGFLKTIDMAHKAKNEVRPIKTEISGNTMYYYYKAMREL